MTLVRFAAGLLLLAGTAAAQGDGNDAWPDYRGPNRDGNAAGASLPLRWSEKKNVRWKTRIPGRGWSSPVVMDGRVWLTSATADGKRMFVIAIDTASGKKILQRTIFEIDRPEPKNTLNSYASPSPAIQEGRVYVHFGTYGTACLDTESGETRWQRRDLNCNHLEGPGSSPILAGELLIFNVDGSDVQYVIALDKRTGKTRWRQPRSVDLSRRPPDMRKAFSTPIVVDMGGETRLISSGAEATMAYDLRSGQELWRVRHRGFSMSSRPLAGDGLLFLNTGFMPTRLLAVKADGEGDVTDTNIVWSHRRAVPAMSSPVLVGGRIFMVSDDGIASCIESRTGKSLWRKRIGGKHCASPIHAEGRIYFFDRDGRTLVVAADRKYRKLAANELAQGFMASPAVVGNALFLRTETHLYRIEEE